MVVVVVSGTKAPVVDCVSVDTDEGVVASVDSEISVVGIVGCGVVNSEVMVVDWANSGLVTSGLSVVIGIEVESSVIDCVSTEVDINVVASVLISMTSVVRFSVDVKSEKSGEVVVVGVVTGITVRVVDSVGGDISVVIVDSDSVFPDISVTEAVGIVVSGVEEECSLVGSPVSTKSVGFGGSMDVGARVGPSVVIGSKVVISGDANISVVAENSEVVVSGISVTEAVAAILSVASLEDIVAVIDSVGCDDCEVDGERVVASVVNGSGVVVSKDAGIPVVTGESDWVVSGISVTKSVISETELVE